jgi:4-hydroxy-2-oxoheptanedioate aldolase
MDTPRNTFKTALACREPQIGFWVAMADPYSAEICAGARFDWIVIDGEHAPNDLPLVLAQLQAVAPYSTHPVVRPPVGDPVLIKQLLDIGAQTLLVPVVETADQARMLVSATRYPPNGIRGVGSALARSSRWSRYSDYMEVADREVCLIVQVETINGLENLTEIAAVEGVDAVFLGPADLSAALGHRGDPGHPDVRAAMEKAVSQINAANKPFGTLFGDELQIRHWMAKGCTFMAVGADTAVLARSTEALAKRYRNLRVK